MSAHIGRGEAAGGGPVSRAEGVAGAWEKRLCAGERRLLAVFRAEAARTGSSEVTLTYKQLSVAARIAYSQVGPFLDRLVELGFLSRVPVPANRFGRAPGTYIVRSVFIEIEGKRCEVGAISNTPAS